MTVFARRLAARLALSIVAVAVAACPAAAGPKLLFDVGTGEVLAAEDAFHPWYPASLTKMMTAYVTFRAIRAGEIRPDTPVVMTANAAKEPPSKMGFKPGSAITVDTALKMLIVKSANDVAVALAETVGGSEAGFVARMNAEARRLGMGSTHFQNPNGLPADGQWTTARDYALLTSAIIREHPEQHDLFRITALSLGTRIIKTHNQLLERYPGTDGMKTGFICSSGFNVVATATRGGRRLAAVVLGEPNAKKRAETASTLLEQGFQSPKGGLFAKRVRLEALRPETPPPLVPADLRPQICGKKQPVGEDAEDRAIARADVAGQPRSYLVPPFRVMDPVPVAMAVLAAPAAALADLPPLPRANPLRADVSATAFAPAGAASADPALAPAGGVPLTAETPVEGAVPGLKRKPIEILGLKGGGG